MIRKMDLGTICRACLSFQHRLHNAQVLTFADGVRVPDAFAYITGVKFDTNALTPLNICSRCLIDITYSYEFILKCQNADRTFRTIFEADESCTAQVGAVQQQFQNVGTLNAGHDTGFSDLGVHMANAKSPSPERPENRFVDAPAVPEKISFERLLHQYVSEESAASGVHQRLFNDNISVPNRKSNALNSEMNAVNVASGDLIKSNDVDNPLNGLDTISVPWKQSNLLDDFTVSDMDINSDLVGFKTSKLPTMDFTSTDHSHFSSLSEKKEKWKRPADELLLDNFGTDRAMWSSQELHRNLVMPSNSKPPITERKSAKNHRCNVCGQYFNSEYCFVEHLCTHGLPPKPKNNIKKLYSCESCPKSFSRSSFLKRHQIMHRNLSYITSDG